MTEVTKSMMDLVMTPEQRQEYLKDYKAELARKHVLVRHEKKLDAAISENKKKLAGLELLTGGLPYQEGGTFHSVYRQANAYLNANYTHKEIPADARDTARLFSMQMRDKRPYTDEQMDEYADNTVQLIEESYHGDPDAVSFWLWAIYDGDYQLMIDREAEGLGFERKTK